jgi:hypothetical protein
MAYTAQLEQVIKSVSSETLTAFFRGTCSQFRPKRRDFSHHLAEDQDMLESLEALGEIEFSDSKRLIVLTGKVKGDMTHRRSRSEQYDVAKRIVKQDRHDAAIFVFYDDHDDQRRFRFSFVTAIYKDKEKREFSTFRRYTYFVAPGQPNGTFLRQIGQCGFDSVNAILEAFSVEAVSKDFYTEIATLFTDLVGGERKIGSRTQKQDHPTLKFPKPDDTERKEFAVRLIGRLIFCWFLKKKTSEAGVPLIPAEVLSSSALAKTKLYYHNVLEPLFFETLNKDQAQRHRNYRDKHWDTIPFLNGGLFEAHASDYYELDNATGLSAKYMNTLDVPDNWLSRLLAVFDQYNFTIDESSPLDIEVALDPEILGRIFENLLAEINPETGEIGISNITPYMTFESEDNHPCVKGIDIARYGLKPDVRYLKGSIARNYIADSAHDKLIAQEIIAHIDNPAPHLLITMFYDTEGRLFNDTCVEIKLLDQRISAKFVMAYYHSTFSNWYAHNFVYNRAIRTMHFINYYVTQIPLPKAVLDNGSQEPVIALVDNILAARKRDAGADVSGLERDIDRLVYSLYGLTEAEVAIVEGSNLENRAAHE